MFERFNRLSDFYQGMVFILAGSIAMLYALGIIQRGITAAIIVFAICMIIVGLAKVGLYKKLLHK